MRINFLLLGVMVSFFVLNCKKKETKFDNTQKVEPSDQDSEGKFKNFAPVVNETPLLPFKTRIKKLAYVARLDLSDSGLENEALFERLFLDRFILGDFDFSAGILEQPAWAELQVERWLQGIQPICSSQRMIEQYPWPNGFGDFIVRAYGRRLNDRDEELRTNLVNQDISAGEKFSLACSVVLSSLEFLSQVSDRSDPLTGYMNRLAANVVQRPLTSVELDKVEKQGKEAVAGILTEWFKSPHFSDAVGGFASRLLRANGETEKIDYNLPANLLAYLARNTQPYSDFITSTLCRDENGQGIPCDTGAPFKAGVLTTRAFLSSNAGPFNLSRAARFLEAFACRSYPLPEELEPPLKKEELIPMFAQETGQGFGNGTNCYLCHAQFGKHAQLFVKFDSEGLYRGEADGQQNTSPEAASGHTADGTFTSHLSGVQAAASESGEFFGKPVENLADAAWVLTRSKEFQECTVRNFLNYFLGLKDTTARKVDVKIYRSVAQELQKSENSQPTIQDILHQSLLNPTVMESFFKVN